MLLDDVSMLPSRSLTSPPSHSLFTDRRRSPSYCTRVFSSSLSDTLTVFASSAYFSLAKEFNVSVDEVASSFSATFGGIAIFMYVLKFALGLPARLTRTCSLTPFIFYCYCRLLLIPISVKYGHRIVYLLSTFLVRRFLYLRLLLHRTN